MNNAFWRTGLAVVLCLLGLLFAPTRTIKGQIASYSFHQVDPGFSPAMDVNDDGTVVGWVTNSAVGVAGYQWTASSGLQPLADPGVLGYFPQHTGINNPTATLRISGTGIIAGVGCPQGCGIADTKAAIWTPADGLAFLGSFDNDLQTSAAAGVNDVGQVVGFSWGGGYNNFGPFIWSSTEGLQHLTGFDGVNGYGADINEEGLVVGTKGTGTRTVAFVWSAAAGQTDIPDVPGAAASLGFAVNDSGVVVGRYFTVDADLFITYHMFRWSAALGTEDINAPPGFPELIDINNSGHVVATIATLKDGRVPYIYRDGIWTDLNQLLPTGTAFTLQYVTAINNNGWIVGGGTTDPKGTELLQGFVLIPPGSSEPPPNTDTGSGVSVALPVTLPGGTSGSVSLTFDNVEGAGDTTVQASSTGPPPPTGFKLTNPPVYYDITTTATFTGSVRVCLSWTEGQVANENKVSMFHYEDNQWVDITDPTSRDTVNNTVCGTTTSLSPFTLFDVKYSFTGFFSPLENAPTMNAVKAGAAVPVKFSLGGDLGLDIFATGFPRTQLMQCDTLAPIDEITETVTAGGSSLSYDPETGRYTYVWKTEKAWGGSCRELHVMLNDGEVYKARFTLRK